MSNNWWNDWQQQRQADELKRQTKALRDQQAELERQAEELKKIGGSLGGIASGTNAINDHLDSLEPCKWCGQLTHINILGYCGERCGYESLGRDEYTTRLKRAEEEARREIDRLERRRKERERKLAKAKSEARSEEKLLRLIGGVVFIVGTLLALVGFSQWDRLASLDGWPLTQCCCSWIPIWRAPLAIMGLYWLFGGGGSVVDEGVDEL
jgi:hypothetical protein